jgi:hypothetical protein
MTTFAFGKFRGYPVHTVPTDYLTWASTIAREPLRTAIRLELGRRADHADVRRAGPPGLPEELRAAVREITRSGFRAVALRGHPDVGGSTEAMRRAIQARDWLEALTNG